MSLVSAVQIPYREARDGFWGEQTSTLNWCEEDYNITYYCAETINTVTNLAFIYLGIKGLRDVIRYSHSRAFIVAWLGYIVVGLGSMAFHATLWYSMQLADELPMIYSVCIMCFIAYSFQRPPAVQALVGAVMTAVAIIITVYYLYAKDPVFHQAAFGFLQLATTFRGFYVTEWKLRPLLKKRNPSRADEQMRETWNLALAGVVMFSTGFIIWLLDNAFCHHLTAAKNHILLPWSAVLEGHGWWHILTGLGAYHMILSRIWLNCSLQGDDFMLDWRPYRSIPRIIPRPGSPADLASKDTKKTK
ncbi:ceramidase [Rhypophila decipiens]|uniref:Ceramidase n=1 Tax=Rhypophila decipiens TaxID=261697 RepID=A0AAN6Y2S8_9PEZI|nr:ceramidase [Rhypophila decipiens]